ncbi:MAG: polysaccharide biosynthesis/export family protein [Cyanobacteria bacterium P01_E01_bin.45]
MAIQSNPFNLLSSATALACLMTAATFGQPLTAGAQEDTLPPVPEPSTIDSPTTDTPSLPSIPPASSTEDEDTPSLPDTSAPSTTPSTSETPSLPSTTPSDPSIPRLDVQTTASEGQYRLGPGDRVAVDIFNVPEFSGEQQVLSDGTVSLSLLGSVSLQGLTLREASDLLTTQYSEFLNNPIVNVILVTARPPRVAVLGEVSTPGPHIFAPVDTDPALTAPTVISMIQRAGGITTMADIRNVQLRRPSVDGPDELIDVDLWSLMQGDGVAADPVVFDGDTIFIPTASEDIPDDEVFLLSSSNLSPETIDIIIVGEVNTPGPVQVPANTPLNQALFVGGDFLRPRANTNQVGLIRLNPNGTVLRQEVPVDLAADVNNESNPTLQDNDILIVGKSGLATFTDGLNTVVSPIEPVVPVFGIINTIDRVFGD